MAARKIEFTPPPQGETRNSKVLASFVEYCNTHPQLRFWQALLNWSGLPFIASVSCPPSYVIGAVDRTTAGGVIIEDTYNWEGRNG